RPGVSVEDVLESGTTLSDRYQLTERVGGGGMGEVWRATDTVLGRTVAVKVLMPALSEDTAFQRRFQNEARAMATLSHPGVVDVYDYGRCEVGGRRVTFLVMEFVEGESLDKRLRRAALTPEATMRLIAEVADALAAAHAQGIVHRDVKPANLIVRANGSVALPDFGIAHSASAGQLTATGSMLCSAGYCAPEMATSSEVTPAVDVYALGVVAYECLTGTLPFQGDTPVQIIYKHLHAPVPPLPPQVPPGPRELVARALEKEPERRYRSAEEMARAARAAQAAPHVAPAPPTPTPVGPPPGAAVTTAPGAGRAGTTTAPTRRRRLMSAAAATALAVLVPAGVAAMVWMRPTGEPQRTSVQPPTTTSASPTPTVETVRPSEAANRTREEGPKRSTPTPSVSPTPKPTPTDTATETPSEPTPSTSDPGPTTEPEPDPTEEPSQEPTGPDPHEPTQEPTQGAGKPTSKVQCVTTPCP